MNKKKKRFKNLSVSKTKTTKFFFLSLSKKP